MTSSRTIPAGALVGALFAAGLGVPAAAGPRPTPPQIEVVSYGGSGCPADTATIVPNLDGTGFTALYDAFEARTPQTPTLRNCTLVLNIKVPAGLKVGIRKVTYRGESVLRTGARAEFKAKYFYQGNSRTLEHPGWADRGPYDGSWDAEHRIKEKYFTLCGVETRLNVTQNLKVSGSGSNVVNLETADSSYSSKWDFDIEEC
ncbi:hypothetical protein GCM10010123_08350 [Pilimelia anulata]|uniref:DUF4360 domain-containing protein n=1 Tax=Pilimelia anulata TaxID=53371 RepID=A0A8J3B3Q7_9ACTN|nr:DUF4360 domain-containing protein [Pilimelia anulata]GGJ80760.1 hypothetical protein GCM10010123_08350 [Pilimelia anulata]